MSETPLSPPDKTKEVLDTLSSTTGSLINAFDNIISLPFVDSLRIDALGEKSIESVILDLKLQYQTLQGNTLPFARDLYGYAGLQLITIPKLPTEIEVATYVNLNKVIIARHKLEAAQVRKESEAFRKKFVAALDLFETSIKELGKQIEELQLQIDDTKDLQEKERAVAAIAGVFTFVFTTAAVFAVIATGGAAASASAGSASTWSITAVQGSAAATGVTGFFQGLGAGLGVSATSGLIGTSVVMSTGALAGLAETIVSSIQARNFGRAVCALEDLKESAEKARDTLIEVVELMSGVEDSLDEIVNVWSEVESSLSIIQSDVGSWNEDNFSKDLANSTVAEWEEVREAVQIYTSVVSGQSLDDIRDDDEKEEGEENEKEEEVEFTGERFVVLSRSMATSELKLAIQAPDIEFDGKLSDIRDFHAALQLAKTLSETNEKLAAQVENANNLLTETETGLEQACADLSSLTQDRIEWMDKFEEADADGKLGLLSELTSSTQSFEDSINQAEETEAKAFSFQSAVGIVNNSIIRLIAEKNVAQQVLMRKLMSIESKRRKRKWLWVVPVAGAINEIIDAANNVRGQIKRMRRDISTLSRCRTQLQKLSQSVSISVKDSTLLVQTFSVILNDTQAGANDAILFDTLGVDLQDDLLTSAKQSWMDLEEDIQGFKN